MEKEFITIVEHYFDHHGKGHLHFGNAYNAEKRRYKDKLFTNGYRPICVVPYRIETKMMEAIPDEKIADLSYEDAFAFVTSWIATYFILDGQGW